jgi:predicted AAA+ superfamily ATPase
LERVLTAARRTFPAAFVTGPRQSGKTTLARQCFPDFVYLNLEDIQSRQEATEDPVGLLRRVQGAPGVIIDEAQRAPDLFSYLQQPLDEGRLGFVVLTGSQNFLMSERIGQTLAGRVAIIEVLPLSVAERWSRPAVECDDFSLPGNHGPTPESLDKVLFFGGFPRVALGDDDPAMWLDSYLQTYVERDVRQIANVGDLAAFMRFLALCAGRTAQLLDASSLGSDAGVSHTTVQRWLSILEASYVISRLQPHHENFSKRVIKSPKLHFLDTGLLCRLLGLRKAEDIRLHPLKGAIFESFVVSELRKRFVHKGQRAPLFFFRDARGNEVDLLIDLGLRRLPVEIKLGETVVSDFVKGLEHYGRLSGVQGGCLVNGGQTSYVRGAHQIRSWSALT